MDKEDNFSEWYNEILKRAEILDVRYPVKGLYVWYPYGLKLRNLIYNTLRSLMEREHEEVLFPLLIRRDELLKEKEHIKGFEEEVFWVTHGGTTKLDIPLALRPTSETAIYPIFKLWIRSHRDLPIRVYQIVNTFRYETKHTRPLIRVREITSFKEAHTAHASRAEAEEQIKKAIALYRTFFDLLAIPYVITRRPNWDKFPGAEYSIAFDTLMPDGRTMQIATIHLLGESFARTFDIRYETEDGSSRFVNQTCYGISERCVAAVIAVHGDDHGLILPPAVAPIQVVIVPIIFSAAEGKKDTDEGTGTGTGTGMSISMSMDQVREACINLYEQLKGAGLRVILDDSPERPGAKYYYWEMKGVPLRIELGPRDLDNNSCVFVRRDDPNFRKTKVPLSSVIPEVRRVLDDIQQQLRARARETLLSNIHAWTDESRDNKEKEGLREGVRGGIISLYLCETENCGKELEDSLGASVLGEVYYGGEESDEENGGDGGEDGDRDRDSSRGRGRCIVCGAHNGRRVFVAHTY